MKQFRTIISMMSLSAMLLNVTPACAQQTDTCSRHVPPVHSRVTDYKHDRTVVRQTEKGAELMIPITTEYLTWMPGQVKDWNTVYKEDAVFNDNMYVTQRKISYYYGNNEPLSTAVVNYIMKADGTVTEESKIVQSAEDKESGIWRKVYLTKYAYDNFDTSFMSNRVTFMWDKEADDWVYDPEGYNFYYDISRDENNNVLYLQGWETIDKESPLLGCYYSYEDGKEGAVGMVVKVVGENNECVPSFYLADMEWESTDGQYLRIGSQVYFLLSVDPNNRIKSYSLYKYESDGVTMNPYAKVYYQWGENDFEKVDIEENDGLWITHQNVMAGDNGYDYDYYCYNWSDSNGNGVYDDGEEVNVGKAHKEEYRFDKYGNMESATSLRYDTDEGSFYSISEKTYEYKYLKDGTVNEQIITYSDDGECVYKERYLYSNFIDNIATGIRNIDNEIIKVVDGRIMAADGMRYVITDIQGRICRTGFVSGSEIIVGDMPSGIYIVNAGGCSVKIIK